MLNKLELERLIGDDYLLIEQKRFIRRFVRLNVTNQDGKKALYCSYKTSDKCFEIKFENLSEFKFNMYKKAMLTMITENGHKLTKRDIPRMKELILEIRNPDDNLIFSKFGEETVVIPDYRTIPAQNLYQAIMLIRKLGLL